jgi:hypothetical protein
MVSPTRKINVLISTFDTHVQGYHPSLQIVKIHMPKSGTFHKGFQVFLVRMHADGFGQVTVAAAITAKHQHTNLPGLWADGKTVSITASTNASATANATTDQLTVAAHGLSENQPVVVGGTAVPGGIQPQTIYWVKVIDANTIQLRTAHDSTSLVDITSTGTSVTVTAVRAFTITYLPTVAGDQAHMPLRSIGRVVLTTGAGDSADILSVRVNQED